MAHPRKLLRQAVAALLAGASTAAAARVYATRVAPVRKDQLPAIAVYTEDEEVDPDTFQTAPRELKRDVDLVIEGYVAHSAAVPVDDAMDNLAEQIEAAMDGDRWLDGTAGESVLARTETGIADPNSDPLIGVVRLTYTVTYRTSPTAPTLTNDFNTVDVKTTPQGGVTDTAPLEDTFTVEET